MRNYRRPCPDIELKTFFGPIHGRSDVRLRFFFGFCRNKLWFSTRSQCNAFQLYTTYGVYFPKIIQTVMLPVFDFKYRYFLEKYI